MTEATATETTTPRADSLLAVGFRLFGSEIPQWRAERIRDVDAGPHGSAHVTVWRSDAALLSVDVYECASADAAGERLQALLREVQSPLMARAGDDSNARGIGDVRYAMPGGGAVFFTRGNLVFVVRDAGNADGVVEIARGLDRWVAEARTAGGDVPPRIESMDARTERTQAHVDVGVSDPLGRRAWLQVRADGARLHIEDGHVVAVPLPDRTATLRVAAVGESGVAVSEMELPRAQ